MSESEPKPPLRFKERLENICRDMVEKGILFSEATEHFERCFITEVLRRNNGNLIRTAARLRHPSQHPVEKSQSPQDPEKINNPA